MSQGWRIEDEDDRSVLHVLSVDGVDSGYVWEFDHASYPHSFHGGEDYRHGAIMAGIDKAKDIVEQAIRPH